MKNILALLMAVCLGSVGAVAQTEIVGTLVDSLSHAGEPFATVSLASASAPDVPFAASVTDADGRFSITAKADGDYVVRFSSVGKATVTRSVSCSGRKVDLGTLLIAEDAQQIEGVEVKAARPLVKVSADELEYSVEDDPESKTQTVLDLLRKVPMVSVDAQDKITVCGNSSFLVYVDGRQNKMMSSNPTQIFRAMPASTVKSVTVVTSPGAKYDAEGTGGVLCLKMADSKGVGDSRMLTIDAVGGNFNSYASLYGMLEHNKLALDVHGYLGKQNLGDVDVESITTYADGSSNSMLGTSKQHHSTGGGGLGATITLDTANMIQVEADFFHWQNESSPRYVVVDNVRSYTQKGDNKGVDDNVSGSIDYTHTFRQDVSLVLGYRFDVNPMSERESYSYDLVGASTSDADLFITDRTEVNDSRSDEHVGQADFSAKLNDHHSVDVGAKYTFRKGTSEATGLDFEHRNSIAAGYASYAFRADAFGAKAGLRYEHTAQDVSFGSAGTVSRGYGNVVPSLSFSYRLGQTGNLGLAYNMRLSRPGIDRLNPFVSSTDEHYVTVGNPNLDVEKRNNISLTYGVFTRLVMLNLSLGHEFSRGGVASYTYSDADRIVTTYGNISDADRTSFVCNTRFGSLWKGASLTLYGRATYEDMRADAIDAHNSGWGFSGMAYLSQQLPREFSLMAYVNYRTAQKTLQGKGSDMMFNMFRLNKTFWNKRITLHASVLNPFTPNLHQDSESRTADYTSHQNVSIKIRSFDFGLNIRFGNTEKRRQSADHEDSDVTKSSGGSVQVGQ